MIKKLSVTREKRGPLQVGQVYENKSGLTIVNRTATKPVANEKSGKSSTT